MLDWLLSGGDPYDGLREMLVHALPSTAQWDRQAMIIAVMVPMALLGLVLSRRPRTPSSSARVTGEWPGGIKVGLGLWRSIWWRIRPIPVAERWQVGAYRVPTKRRMAIGAGVTGSRKSTVGMQLLTDERHGMVLTGEPADPFRKRILELRDRDKAIYWNPRGTLGWDMLVGDPIELAENLTAGTTKTEGDTGLGRGYVQDVTALALAGADAYQVVREWRDLHAVLHVPHMTRQQKLELLLRRPFLEPAMIKADEVVQYGGQEARAAFARWAQRFEHMCMGLGPALGHDFNLNEALAAGLWVMMEMAASRSPESTPHVAANVLLAGKRATHVAKGGRLIVDEGWAFKQRKAEVNEVVRAGRRVGWEVYDFTQLVQDYDDEMLGNTRTALFMMQTDTNVAGLEWCSKVVHRKLPADAFSEGTLKEGDGWLLHGGRLVRFNVRGIDVSKVPDPQDVPMWCSIALHRKWATSDPPGETGGEESDPGAKVGNGEVWEQVEPDRESRIGWFGTLVEGFRPMPLPAGRIVVPPWIAGNKRRLEHFQTLSGTDEEYGDHLWTKGRNKEYGKAAYANASGWQSHFLFWAWKVQWDREQGEEPSDVEEFCHDHPDMVPFVWPEVRDELLVLRALKQWMAQPFGADPKSFQEDDPRRGVFLSIDHGCPGWPNTLCQNWRHLKIMTNSRNSELRHSRRNGAGRLEAEAR